MNNKDLDWNKYVEILAEKDAIIQKQAEEIERLKKELEGMTWVANKNGENYQEVRTKFNGLVGELKPRLLYPPTMFKMDNGDWYMTEFTYWQFLGNHEEVKSILNKYTEE